MNTDLTIVSLEQYFLSTALQTGFTPYQETCHTLMEMGLSDTSTAELYAQYETALQVSAHLQNTAALLQTETLSQGQSNLASLRVANTETTNSFRVVGVLLFFVFLAIIFELIQDIVVPVLRLADASAAVGDGNFDTPDILLSNRDELYTLALTFNEMKHNMKNLFTALQRQSEMEQRLHQQEIEQRETASLLAEAQMQQLRNQINPHFLFNTLNIISRTARYEKARKSERLILSLSRLFRYGLKTDADEVPLRREMNIVNDYISIQSTRFEGRVALDWRISSKIDPETLLVPTFLLQPLVENAVIHGLEPKVAGGQIRIRAQKHGNALHLTLIDNGVGMSAEKLATFLTSQANKGHVSGIGIANVRSRLTLLHPNATFAVQSRLGRGTRITLQIPEICAAEQEVQG